MEKFKYKFTPLAIILIIIGMLAAVVTSVINVINIVKQLQNGLTPEFSKYIIVFIALLFIVFLVIMLINSYYQITESEIKVKLSLISSSIKVKDITKITHFTKSDRLVIFFQDETFTNIVIKPSQFLEFIKKLKKANSKILHTAIEE